MLAVFVLLVAGEPARGRYMPLQTTPLGVADRAAEITDIVEIAHGIVPTLGISDEALRQLTYCSSIERAVDEGDAEALRRCAEALGGVYGALVEPAEADPRRRGVRWFVARVVADAALRVTSARAAARAGDAGALAPGGAVPTQVLVHEDYRTLRIRPLRALRPGRTWALQISGLTPEERAVARETVVPKHGANGLEITPGSLVERVVAGMRDDPSEMDHDTAIEVARQIEADGVGQAGASPTAGVQLQLPERLRAVDLERLVATFVPAKRAEPDDTIVALPVVDLRESLRPAIERLDEQACPAPAVAAPEDLRAAVQAEGATVLRGVYPSLSIVRPRGDRIAEVSADEAEPVELPYLLAVPEDVGAETPLVLAVHGHGGNAPGFFADHADALLSRGAAVLAVELPAHGLRGAREREFLGVLDPVRMRVNYRQALLDVVAVLRVVDDCGLVLPDGTSFRPSEVRYLGYSFGGLLGVSLRALVPSLGPTVLAAAAGDLAGWLMLHFPNYLDSPVLSCIGGPDHGRHCLYDRACAAPGLCWTDSFFVRMAFLLDFPFGLVLADAEPLGPARIRTGAVAKSPVLLLTAGDDGVLFTLLQARLGDAYDMHGEPPADVRGPHSKRLHWPSLGHDLLENDEVRTRAYDFLAPREPAPARVSANPSVDNP